MHEPVGQARIVAKFCLRYKGFGLDVELNLPGQGITALLGHSGSGKTTILRCIAGLIRAPGGYLALGSDVWQDEENGIFLPTHRRPLGMVFQEGSLFPHLSARKNLRYGMKRTGGGTTGSFDNIVSLLGIEPILDQMPATLSGGERQRVAIGRALLCGPRLLLFDEPLAALDMERRLEILPLIERVRDEFAMPIVYVSHAVEEVARLAKKIVVLDAGRVKAIGDPGEVFGALGRDSPWPRFDRVSVLSMTVSGENAAYGLTELKHPAGTVWLAGPAGPLGGQVRIIVKATDVVLAARPPRDLSVRSALAGRIAGIEKNGPLATVEIALEGEGRLYAVTTRHALDELGLVRGARLFALIKTSALDERQVAAIPRGS